jgi:predicted RNase H-like nuclease (RuvC/YqgF family)
MTKNENFQKELAEKVKEGVKPSQLKRSTSTPVKSVKENSSPEATIKKLEEQNAQLLAFNQEAVKQNEQLVKVIEKLKKEKKNLEQEKSVLEEKLLEKRLELLNTPLNSDNSEITKLKNQLLFYQQQSKKKSYLLIALLIVLISILLFR